MGKKNDHPSISKTILTSVNCAKKIHIWMIFPTKCLQINPPLKPNMLLCMYVVLITQVVPSKPSKGGVLVDPHLELLTRLQSEFRR